MMPRKDILKGMADGGCVMTVYLDRVRIVGALATRYEAEGKHRELGGVPDAFVNELVLPHQVAGIEIYPRAVGAPPQYQSSNGKCGVMLIWTK